jgi:dGTPase
MAVPLYAPADGEREVQIESGDDETFKKVEVLKNFAYQGLIMSPMLKVAEHRGKEIVQETFRALDSAHGHLLMPSDCRALYGALKEPDERRRVVCDFMAGMTDRYAIQFYGRLFGTNPESIYSPLCSSTNH